MCLDTVTDMNKPLNIVRVTGDNSDTVWEKFSIMDLVIIIMKANCSHFVWGISAIPMIADEDAVDYIPKNLPQCDRGHRCAHGTAART